MASLFRRGSSVHYLCSLWFQMSLPSSSQTSNDECYFPHRSFLCPSTIQESIDLAEMAQRDSAEVLAFDRLLSLHSHNCLLDTVTYKKKQKTKAWKKLDLLQKQCEAWIKVLPAEAGVAAFCHSEGVQRVCVCCATRLWAQSLFVATVVSRSALCLLLVHPFPAPPLTFRLQVSPLVYLFFGSLTHWFSPTFPLVSEGACHSSCESALRLRNVEQTAGSTDRLSSFQVSKSEFSDECWCQQRRARLKLVGHLFSLIVVSTGKVANCSVTNLTVNFLLQQSRGKWGRHARPQILESLWKVRICSLFSIL